MSVWWWGVAEKTDRLLAEEKYVIAVATQCGNSPWQQQVAEGWNGLLYFCCGCTCARLCTRACVCVHLPASDGVRAASQASKSHHLAA